MPQVIAAAAIWVTGSTVAVAATATTAAVVATGVAATAFTVAGMAVSYATLIGYAVTIGGAMAYGASQNSKMKNALRSVQEQGRNVMARDPVSAHRAIYGQVRVSGPLSYMATAGTKNENLYLNVVLAAHECDTLGEITFEGPEVVPLDGSDEATGKYAGFCNIKKYTGTNAQNADAVLQAAFAGVYTSAHRGRGRAHLRVRLKYSADLYPNGIPTITCRVKGRKVLDPRVGIYTKTCDMEAGNNHIGAATGSLAVGMRVIGQGIVPGTRIAAIDVSGTFFTVDTPPQVTNTSASLGFGVDAWSSNAALCTADYMADTQFGKGIPWSRIDLTSLTESANICDEDIVLDDASTEKRYTMNGTTNADQSPDMVLQSMCAAMSGFLVDTGGVWHVRAGAYRTPELTLTDDELVGSFTVHPRQSRRETFNGVRGTFIGELNQNSAADFPPVKNDTYMSQDGHIRLWKDVSYPWTNSSATCQRLAKTDLERGRQQIICTGLYKLKSFKAMPGDTVLLTRASLGWTNKKFELTEWAFQILPGSKGVTLGVQCTFRETASEVWDWNNGEETTTDLAPNTSLPDPTVVPTPTLTLLTDTTTVTVQPDGTVQPRLKVSWLTPNNIYVESGGVVEIEYKKTSESEYSVWSSLRGDALFDYILDVKIGEQYNVRVRFKNQIGVRGAYAPATSAAVVGDTVAPNAPSTLTAVAKPGFIDLNWTPSNSNTVNEYAIYRSIVSAIAGFALLANTANSQFQDTSVAAGTTYWYYVLATSRSEIASVASNVAGPTTAQIAPSGAVPSNASAPAQPGTPVTGTYDASDGSVFSFVTLNVFAMPAGAVWQNLLYRRSGSGDWLIGAQLKNTGTITMRLDDLSPGIPYNIAVQAWNGAGASSIITGTTFTAPSKTGAPPAVDLRGNSLETNENIPPVFESGVRRYGMRWLWVDTNGTGYTYPSDFSHWEVKSTATNSDAATDYNADNGGSSPQVYKSFEPYFDFYVTTPVSTYKRVRAVNKSGIAGPWAAADQWLAGDWQLPGGDAMEKSVGTGAGTVAAGNDTRIVGAAQKASNLSDIASPSTALSNLGGAAKAANLSDLPSPSTARGNLGLGTAATQAVAAFLQTANNLSDLPSPSTARGNLGLGTAATQAVATFLQTANNLSDLGSPSTARLNLGLYLINTVINLVTGATSEDIAISIAGLGFAAKPSAGFVVVEDLHYTAFYDYSNGANSSTVAILKFHRFDNAAMGVGALRLDAFFLK